MWYPDRPEVYMYKHLINDSFKIKDLFPWAFTESGIFLNFLKENIREDDIIITHHIPNKAGIPIHWLGAKTETYFLNNDCNQYFNDINNIFPKAWIFGHTHSYANYRLGRTKFICNPVGYPYENPNWRKRKFIYEL